MALLPDLMRLDGRCAIVTGGAMGLGAAVATLLAQQGARVAILDRNEPAAGHHAGALTGQGLVASAHACDVTDQRGVEQAVDAARQAHGPVRIVANCAGIVSSPGMPYTNNTGDDFDQTMAVNVRGMFFVAKACHADLVAHGGGRLVNLSSITGVISAAYMPAYSVSKAAVISLTKVLARDLAPHQATANAVCPGFIWTPLWEQLGRVMAKAEGSDNPDDDARSVFDRRIRSHVPMRRPQTAEDVAALVTFGARMRPPTSPGR